MKAPRTKRESETARGTAPATAAGQALGYGLQYTRLTAMLFSAPPGSVCTLELLDDVASETTTGVQHFVQSKSALRANPVADRSTSLWKSLYNWMQLVKRGLAKVDSAVFELYVSRPVDGAIINAFANADNVDKARLAVSFARELLWGKGPNYPLKLKLSQEVAKYANHVLATDLDTNNIVAAIIARTRLVCGSGSPQADIESIISSHPVSQIKVPTIADHMCGWVKRRVDERLEKSLPAVIPRDEFHSAYTSYCRSIDRDTILRSLARKPTDAEKLERMPDIFVQQLDLIGLSFEDKLEAISDFLRSCWDRCIWAKAGDVDESSFDDLDDTLTRTWRNHSRVNKIEHQRKTEIEKGQLLYTKCMGHAAMVQGMEPPAHFIPGCFHRLADEMQVGWHPEYQRQLKSLTKAGA